MKKFGDDGRMLSSFQQRDWMQKIGKNRKYKNQSKGEKHWGAKLTEKNVRWIRHFDDMPRSRAERIGSLFSINPTYVYHIRRRKTWRHLRDID